LGTGRTIFPEDELVVDAGDPEVAIERRTGSQPSRQAGGDAGRSNLAGTISFLPTALPSRRQSTGRDIIAIDAPEAPPA